MNENNMFFLIFYFTRVFKKWILTLLTFFNIAAKLKKLESCATSQMKAENKSFKLFFKFCFFDNRKIVKIKFY